MIFISTILLNGGKSVGKIDVPAYKVDLESAIIIHFLEHIASFGRPVILSTGMNTIDGSITKAVAIFDTRY
jgi:N-acetylneuraminate synthase